MNTMKTINNAPLSTGTSNFAASATPRSTHRVLVALDASPQSMAALESAVALALLLKAELCGIFVQDTDLERLCSLPFNKEIGAYSATARTLSQFCIGREFRSQEEGIRLALQRSAERGQVPWEFRVTRGGVIRELLAAAQEATILSLGRSGWSQRRQFGSTAATMVRQSNQPVLLPALFPHGSSQRVAPRPLALIKVVYTGTAPSERALRLAQQMAQVSEHGLIVYASAEMPPTSLLALQSLDFATVVAVARAGTAQMIEALERGQPGLTILADVDSSLTMILLDVVLDPILLVS